jgi:hypothetical protein
LKQPEDMKQTPEEEHREAKMEYAVFQMERMLNDVKCMRIQKTKQRYLFSSPADVPIQTPNPKS